MSFSSGFKNRGFLLALCVLPCCFEAGAEGGSAGSRPSKIDLLGSRSV